MDITALRPLFSSLSKGAVIGIDGRCASGKTTLSRALEQEFSCRTVHMDDFFLPPPMRTDTRLKTPGGNVHFERFLSEAAPHLKDARLVYRAFDCASLTFFDRTLPPAPFTVVEGSYSMHPALRELYDLKIFLSVDENEQRRRILAREGARAQNFFDKWIPLEELYFRTFDIESLCDIVLKEC